MESAIKNARWLIPAILYPLSSILAQGDVPWPDGAVARYRVEMSGERPTNDVAVCAVRFFSGGILAAGSQNVRVTDSKGNARPIEIIYTHPLNASMVLFSVPPGEDTAHLFFGGSLTSGVAPTNFGRGLFYETRARPDGDSSTWDSMRKLWSAAATSMGVAVLDDTQSRCNPFDESENQFMSRTWGAWQTPREDVYKVGLFAKDHGFLAVNGQPVASTPADVTVKTPSIADVLLPRGTQALEILQARVSGFGVTGISWLVPWPEYHYANLVAKPVAPVWHPSVVGSMVRDYRLCDQATAAFFNDFQTDMLLGADQPVVMVRFHNRTVGKTEGVTYQWDFGDGTTSAEPNPAHVYVKPGRYTVTLTAGASKFQKVVLATSFSALPKQKIPMSNSVSPVAAQEMIRLVTPMLGQYEPGTLWTLIAIAEQISDRKLRAETILKLAPLYLTKSGTVPTTVELSARQKIADAKADLGQWDAAVAELQQMDAKLEKQRTLRTRVRLEIGKLQLRAARYPQSIEAFNQIIKDKGGDDPKLERSAQIALGDAFLQQGDLASARKAYDEAKLVEVGDGRTEREQAIRRGSLYSTLRQGVGELTKMVFDPGGYSEIGSRDTITALADKVRTSFDSLVFEFPDARLNPDVVYLNAQLLLATQDTDAALAELKTLTKAEPTGRYALRSTLLEIRAAYFKKEYEKAAGLVEAVLKTTKEEEAVKEATALQALVKDAIQSKALFADAAKRYWPTPLLPDPSFEKTEVVSNAIAHVEFSTPAEPPKAQAAKFSIVDGFGTDGRKCVQIELPQAVAPPVYVTIRFPTGIGDRLFARCNILCTDADFRWSELRRSTTQSDGVYSIVGAPAVTLQQWGWLEPINNVEPWRTFSWRTGPATTGEPKGYMHFLGSAKEGRKVIPAGTRIYVDAADVFLAP
jgi:PKD repeat protein